MFPVICVRPFAAVVRGDSGKLEQLPDGFVVELEALGRNAARPSKRIPRV